MKCLVFGLMTAALLAGDVSASLLITGVLDGDLTGGNPKAVVLTATSNIADLSLYGIGSANNGGGTDGQEFALSGSAWAGDIIFIAGNTESSAFLTTHYAGQITVLQTSAANINGDDAIELFQNGSLIDTYGVATRNGDDESWDYTDGYAVRIGGSAGAFSQANYTTVFNAFKDRNQAFHTATLASVFVPEPGPLALLGLGGLLLTRRCRPS